MLFNFYRMGDNENYRLVYVYNILIQYSDRVSLHFDKKKKKTPKNNN